MAEVIDPRELLRGGLSPAPRRPVLPQHGEQKRRRQAEQHHAVQRLYGAHQLPVLREEQIGVTVARHRVQRIEHGGSEIGPSAEGDIGAGPGERLDRVKDRQQQDRDDHQSGEHHRGSPRAQNDWQLEHDPVTNFNQAKA